MLRGASQDAASEVTADYAAEAGCGVTTIGAHQVSEAKDSSNDECGQDSQIASTIVGGSLTRGIVSDGAKQVGDIREAQRSQKGINTCSHKPLSSHNGFYRCSGKTTNCSAIRLPCMPAAEDVFRCWAWKKWLEGQT